MRARLIFLLSALLLLSGCFQMTLIAKHDTRYKEHLTSVLIWESGSLQNKYSVLQDRVSRLVTRSAKDLESQGVKTAILKTNDLNLNLNEIVRSEIQRTNAKQILRIEPTRVSVRTTVEYYDIKFSLIDSETGREVWNATLYADFYSGTDSMAQKLISQLKQDGLL